MLALRACIGQTVRDANGARVGRVADLAVRMDEPAPSVSALVVRESRRRAPLEFAWSEVASFEATEVVLGAGARPRGPGAQRELRMVRDVLDAQIVDVAGGRVVRVVDVDLDGSGDELRVVGVDVGTGAVLRRLGLRRLAARWPGAAIASAALHIASGPGHALALDTPTAAVHRLSGAELAQVAARLPRRRGADVLRAVGPERAAGAVTAAHAHAAGGLLRTLGAEDAAPILSVMPPDAAAAALREVEPSARADLLAASILPLSTAYSVSEALGVEGRLDDPWREARVFYATYGALVVVAVAIVLVPGAPLVGILFISQALNAVLLRPLLVFIRGLACDRELMDVHALGRGERAATAAAIGGLAVCVAALAVLSVA